ncbi:JAB1/Mov34/MPN/PAD-1 ubiquitin protease-domain-containing protein [Limtongia smithiae]|uniref:JAB1/Mov34/MPN/PAD-1 ubiquitin protease-domain-containing protein n=1 Tax=Limtongia smithiae TaxID=1125753 RepID=UPI0034D01B3E
MAGDSFLHLVKPVSVMPPMSTSATSPLNVVIHPQALLSILDHTLRRNNDHERVVGSLLGVRSDDGSEVEIRTAFAVPYRFSGESHEVQFDMDYEKVMYNLYHKANPKEVLVGWYATGLHLNAFNSAIHNWYQTASDGTAPYPAVHLTFETDQVADMAIKTYVSTPMGVLANKATESYLYVPVPHEVRYAEAERSALELVVGAKDVETREATIMNDIASLERAIEQVLEMLDRVSTYVSRVSSGESEGSIAIGKYLQTNLALAPKVDAEELEKLFSSHLQDVLLVVYLTNTLKTQMELFNSLKRSAVVA